MYIKDFQNFEKNWILERDDVEEYIGREMKPEDNGLREGQNLKTDVFEKKENPLRAKKGKKCYPNALCKKTVSLHPKWSLSQ